MQRISEDRILSAIGSFYEAAQNGTRAAWVDVWKELAITFRSGMGGFSFYNTQEDNFTTLVTDADQKLLAKYASKYQSTSAIRKAISRLKAGERFNRQEHIPDDEFMRTEMYTGFYKPAGIFHLEYQVFSVRPGMHGGVSFSRPYGEPNFDAGELKAMAVMLPHLERAFQFHAGFIDDGFEGKILSAAFDRIATNIIVIDRELNLAFANNAARELIAENDGMELRENRLCISNAGEGEQLAAHIESVSEMAGDRHDEVMLISRSSGRRPLAVRISPLDNEKFLSLAEKPLAMLFISDPEHSAEGADDVLIQAYGLTPAEARIAALLAEVNDIKAVCALLGISVSTGRTHLKRIFSKTDTNRQGALIKLIMSGPAGMR